MRSHVSLFAATALLGMLASASAQTPPQPPGKPSDGQVRQDIWRDGKGMLDFKATAGKGGEFEWDPRSRTWFFQRGFIVTREGGLADQPQARLEVGGLAIYRWTGSGWSFQKQLVTFNRYTGIPSPSDDELLKLAREGGERVFRQDLRQMTKGLEQVVLSKQQLPRWHNANSLSFWVEASYEYRVPSNGSVVPCTTLNEVRIYRQNPQAAWTNASGLGRKVLSGCGAPGR